jgi:CheY-like chemotaxis protein
MASRSILIIEDDEDIRTVLVEFLESLGHTVEAAVDGEKAMKVLKSGATKPGLILLDMMMPVMDGLTFLGEYAKSFASEPVPIIAMTADSKLLKLALDAGARGGIRKPMDLDDLMTTLAQYGYEENAN